MLGQILEILKRDNVFLTGGGGVGKVILRKRLLSITEASLKRRRARQHGH